MNAPVRPLLVLALALFGLLLLFGCITPPEASRCSGFASASDHNGCLNYYAVWNQEPYLCYSISDSDLRGACLEAANDPVEQQKLQSAQANGIPATTPAAATPTPSPVPSGGLGANATAPANYPPGSMDAQIAQCMAATASTHDACARQIAIGTLNMTLCGSIEAGDYRASCISNVALTAKKQSLCDVLNRTADKQICTYYSSG
ncbi:MAG: hypothetical protein KGH63_00415 [Candidatus Micrarchaeota archaeon]|nr:hypothetical protein [Candidatus Micrarchaeota archaeon]